MAFLPRRRRDEYEDQFLVDVIPPEYLPELPPGRPNVLPGPPPGYRPPALPATPFESARPGRSTQFQAELDTARRTAPGRGKSGLRGALRGLAQGLATGGGLGAGLGGAAAGALGGAIDPRGLREAEFRERDLPRLQGRWQLEDYGAGMQRQAGIDEQNAMMNQMQMANMQSQIDLRSSEAAQNRLPRPVAGPTARWERGRNRRTGQFTVYNAADSAQNAEHEPYIEPERGWAPDWVETPDQGYVNLNDPKTDPKKVRRLQRPRGAPKPKDAKKVASMDDVRAAAEKAGVTPNQMAAKYREQGWVIETRR